LSKFLKNGTSQQSEKDIQLANEIFDLGLVYLMNTEADITKEELIKASLERSDSVQTLAQRLLDEGMEKGMERGIEKGKYDEKLKIALNLQKKSLSIETIAEVTELNPDDVKKLFEKKK